MEGSNRRHHYRVFAELPAVVHPVLPDGELGEPIEVRILDLSAGGVLLSGGHALTLWRDLCLRIGEGDADWVSLTAPCKVVRSHPDPDQAVVALEFGFLSRTARIKLIGEILGLAHALGQGYRAAV